MVVVLVVVIMMMVVVVSVVVVGPALGKMMDFVERGKEEKERMGDMTGGEKAADYSSNVTPMQPYNTSQCSEKQIRRHTQIQNNKKNRAQCNTAVRRHCTDWYEI